eukprot:TRINITY_DN6342_c0_g1_i21.p1 TRINITY_DN6342_c0_g1~~TRINITY_DN6342_c0_g1_i21.p1  ORF type:complete len:196 (+),score=16.39 TRINITY_DN6342_c0_g1_i21:118-705(+)
MPKLVINAVDDEFLQGDNDFYWWDFMPEPKFRQIDQNAEHSEVTGIMEIIGTLGAWANTYFEDAPWPKMTWSIDPNNGSITVWNNASLATPLNVTMWSAPSWYKHGKRDWRIAGGYEPTLPQIVLWSPTPLKETTPGSNTWLAEWNEPNANWIGFFVEMYFQGPPRWNSPNETNIYRLTTQTSYIPKNKWYTYDC